MSVSVVQRGLLPLIRDIYCWFGAPNFLILDNLLFTFKFLTYNSRSSGKLNIKYFKTIIYKTGNIELVVSKTVALRKQKYINKWQPIPIT